MEELINPYDTTDKSYQKSNFLIGAKYASSLMENKILAIALSDQSRMSSDAGGTIRVNITAAELRNVLGGNEGSFYQNLKSAAKAMNNRQIGMVDNETRKFAYYQIIQTCIYSDGELRITFNSDLSKYLKDIQKNFTILKLDTMISFKSDYSFRLYELLRSRCYNDKGSDPNNKKWIFNYNLAELQFMLGIADASDKEAEDVLNLSNNPDYEKAVQMAKSKREGLIEWSPFRRSVLLKAVKEINEKTELIVEFVPQKTGVGGRVVGVEFIVVERTEDVVLDGVYSEKDKEALVEWLIDNIDVKIKVNDARNVCQASDYNKAKLQKAVEILNAQTTTVGNVPGFLISAMQENYEITPASETVAEKSEEEMIVEVSEILKNALQSKVKVADVRKVVKSCKGNISVVESACHAYLEKNVKADNPIDMIIEIIESGDYEVNDQIMELSQEEKDEIIDWINDELPLDVTLKDCKAIAEKAGYDKAKLQSGLDVLNRTTMKIDNTVGFMLRAIEFNWKAAPKAKEVKESSNSFRNFVERTYDYDALAKEIMSENFLKISD